MFRIRKPIPQWQAVLLGILSAAIVIGLYNMVSINAHHANPDDTTVPSMGQLGGALASMLEPNRKGDIEFFMDLKASLSRFGLGLACSALLSILLGVFMGFIPRVDAFFSPLLGFLSKLIPMAMISVFFVLIGLKESLFVTIIAFGITPTLTLSVRNAARGVPDQIINKAFSLGASSMETMWSIGARQILPDILKGLQLSTGPALNYLIGAEMLLADVGFGYRIRILSRVLEMNTVFVYLVVLAIFAYLADFLFKFLQAKACRWSR